jgi:hypothetical protein
MTTTESIVLAIGAMVLMITIMLLGSMALCFRHTEKMAELGYVEVAYPGSNYMHWEKAK